MNEEIAPQPDLNQTASSPGPQLDLAQIKSMLNLPETASDIELITALVELIASLQQKYDALLSDAVTLEDKVANRDLEDYADIITPDTQDFWRQTLLANRDEAVRILKGIRKDNSAIPPSPVVPQREPLRNRLVDVPKSLSELAGGPAPADAARAVAIRNRAHDLRKTEKLQWGEAFARAEKEYMK